MVYVEESPPSLPVNKDMPNLGARVTIYNTKGERLARLGDILPGDAPNQFVAPYGVAVDSRGDIYVGEVSWTVKGSKLSPPRELRSFWKLVRVKSA